MALQLTYSLRGMAPHPFWVKVTVRDLQKTKIVSPQGEEARKAFVEEPTRAAFDAAIAEGQPEAYALGAAERARLHAVALLNELIAQDRRSTAKAALFIREEDAKIPDAKPEETLWVSFDYDMESGVNALEQAYEAVKADPRFTGAVNA